MEDLIQLGDLLVPPYEIPYEKFPHGRGRFFSWFTSRRSPLAPVLEEKPSKSSDHPLDKCPKKNR